MAWLPSVTLMVASYMLASLAGMHFAAWVGSVSIGGFLVAFVGGTLVASMPRLWLYFRYVPLVRRQGRT